ncbi:hypothetical protein Efla_005331 [Eimeria flavescens]
MNADEAGRAREDGDRSNLEPQAPASSAAKAAAAVAAAAVATGAKTGAPAADAEDEQQQWQQNAGVPSSPTASDAEALNLSAAPEELSGGRSAPPCEMASGGSTQQRHSDGEGVEFAMSAALAAAATAAASANDSDIGLRSDAATRDRMPEEKGGLASSVLSALLSAALRHLLPWVLPTALSGSAAKDVQIDLRKKQMSLTGVSLQPQSLMLVSGSPLQLLHCSLGSIKLRLGKQGKAAGAADAAAAASPADFDVRTNSAGTASHAKAVTAALTAAATTAAAATAVTETLKKEGASSVLLSVEDVLIVLAPMYPAEWSRQQLTTLALQRRQSRLATINRELQQEQQQKRSFTVAASSLISQWIERHIECASVDISNMHVRFEALLPLSTNHSSTARSKAGNGIIPFALGFKLQQLHVRTVPHEEFAAASRSVAGEQVQQQEQQAVADSGVDANPKGPGSSGNWRDSQNKGSESSSCSAFDVRHFTVYMQDELLLLTPHTRTVAGITEQLHAVASAHQQRQKEPQGEQQHDHSDRQQSEQQREQRRGQRPGKQEPLQEEQQQQEGQRSQDERKTALGDLDAAFDDEHLEQEQKQHQRYHGRTRVTCTVASASSEGRQSECSDSSSGSGDSSGATLLLDPVTVQLFLRKNRMAATPVEERDSNGVRPREGSGSSDSAAGSHDDCIKGTVPANVGAKAAAVAGRSAYVAVVQAGGLRATLSPAAVRGIRWLAASAEQHREAVEAAEAVLSLVRPFRPSCKVKGNSGIWWRFAIRAVQRLMLRSSLSSSSMVDLKTGLAVEETLKLRLMQEKASSYRSLRLLQLQGKASPEQQELLLQLRDTIPLPLLLRSHTAAGRDFVQVQEAAAAAKGWSRWIPLFRKKSISQDRAAAAITNTAGTAKAPGGRKVPPLPPLSFQKLLEQQRKLREGGDDQRYQAAPEEEAYFSDLDDFFDARSQPGTFRYRGGNTSRSLMENNASEGSTAALLQAVVKKEGEQTGEEVATTGNFSFPEVVTDGESYFDKALAGQRRDVAPADDAVRAAADLNKEGDNKLTLSNSPSDESDDDAIFEDCSDALTPRQLSVSSPHLHVPQAPIVKDASARAVASDAEREAALQVEKQQSFYALSVCVLVSSASLACSLDNEGREHELRFRQQQLPADRSAKQQRSERRLFCSVGCLRLEGLVGTEHMEGSASIGCLDINLVDGRTQRNLPLVCRHSGEAAEPLLLLHVLCSSKGAVADVATISNCGSSNGGQTGSAQSSQKRGLEAGKAGATLGQQAGTSFVGLTVRRVYCLLDPEAVRDTSLLGTKLSGAARVASAAAAESSTECSLLQLRRSTFKGRDDAAGPGGAAWEPTHRQLLRQRLLLLSPERQQQLRYSAALSYVVSVEAPTFIAPAAGGQAVLCHLGELRVCSAQTAKIPPAFASRIASGRAVHNLEFADSVLQDRYVKLFQMPGEEKYSIAPPESSDAASLTGGERVRHVSLRVNHGVLLRDSHVLIHPSLDQLKLAMQSDETSSRRSPSTYNQEAGHRRWRERKEDPSQSHQQSQQSSSDDSELTRPLGEACEGGGPSAPFSAWDGCAAAHPVLFPSEFVAAIELQHVDAFNPGELLLPLDLQLHQKIRRPQAATTPSATAIGKSHDEMADGGDAAKPEAALLDDREQLHQQRHHSVQEEHSSEVHVRIDGNCSEALSAALAGDKPAGVLRDTVNISVRAHGAAAPLGRNMSGELVHADMNETRRVPVYVAAAIDWEKASLYLHHLDCAGASRAVGSDDSVIGATVFESETGAEDALLFQASGLSILLNSSNSNTAGMLMIKELLLEQPCLPKESVNRYILRLPSFSKPLPTARWSSTGAREESASAADAEASEQVESMKSLLLNFKAYSTVVPGISSFAVSVCVLQPTTLNFRPTPLTWLLSFAKEPAGCHSNNSNSGGNTASQGSTTRSPRGGIDTSKISLETVKGIDASDEVPGADHDIGTTAADAGVSFGQNGRLPDSYVDPPLRELCIEFHSVDFLWTTRQSDLQLATAALQGASVQLRLHRHSAHFSAGLQNLSLDFVLDDATPEVKRRSSSKLLRSADRRRKDPESTAPISRSSEASAAEDERPTILTTEILELLPSGTCAMRVTLDSIHPLSPSFTGLSSRLLVDMGRCRLVYIHPKFWRLFNWVIDDFVGTLTLSYPPPPPSLHENGRPSTGGEGSKTMQQGDISKPIQRSPSLEELALQKALEEDSATSGRATTQQGEEEHRTAPSCKDVYKGPEGKGLLLLPNEGLRRIFLLADAARVLLGLDSTVTWLENQHLLSVVPISSSGTREATVLLLPHALPFGVFQYEVRIGASCLLVPPTCRPSIRSLKWPPTSSTKRTSCEGSVSFRSGTYGGANTGGGESKSCRVCSGQGGTADAHIGAGDGREVECLLESVVISNSWCLSRKHGLVEDVSVAFKGARAFANVDGRSCGSPNSNSVTAVEAEYARNSGAAAAKVSCRRCARRMLSSPEHSFGSPCPAFFVANSAEGEVAELKAHSAAARGKYLFGSVDVSVHMYRPALLRVPSTWLRVEVGLLPVRLDAQTLKLLCDVLEGNVAFRDSDVLTKLPVLAEAPRGRRSPSKCQKAVPAAEAARAAVHPKEANCADGDEPRLLQATHHISKDRLEQGLSALMQHLQEQRMLQGLLEPQLDFVELLEEWGRESLILELLAQGVHLAICEPPVQQQILQLRRSCTFIRHRIRMLKHELQTKIPSSGRHRTAANASPSKMPTGKCQEVQQQQTPFLFFHATRVRAQVRSVSLHTETAEQVGLLVCEKGDFDNSVVFESASETQGQPADPKPCVLPPVGGTVFGMRVGSSTLFSAEFAPPFSIIFTDSCCPLELLQQQLEVLADSTRLAEEEAIGVALAAVGKDYAAALKANPQVSPVAVPKDGAEPQVDPKWKREHSVPSLQQHEHPLVTALAAPWVDRLELELSQDIAEGGNSSEFDFSAARASFIEAGENSMARRPSRQAESLSSSSAPLDPPFAGTNYAALFPAISKASGRAQCQQEPRRLRAAVASSAPSVQPVELLVVYRSASTLPVTPLWGLDSSTAEALANSTGEKKLQLLEGLLGERRHQRKQRRINVLSRSPRCVLSLPLLARIGAFFSDESLTEGGAPKAEGPKRVEESQEVSGGVSSAHHRSRSSASSPKSNERDESALVAPLIWPSGLAAQAMQFTAKLDDLPSMISRKPPPYRCRSSSCLCSCAKTGIGSLNRSSSAGASLQAGKIKRCALSTGSSSATPSSDDDSISATCHVSGQDSPTRSELVPRDLTCFGSKAFNLCRHSFESAQRLASAFGTSGGKQQLQVPYLDGATGGDGTKRRPVAVLKNRNIGSGPARNTARLPQLRKAYWSPVAIQVPASPPLNLTSVEASVRLVEASVLVPVNSSSGSSACLILRASVDLRRRSDAAEDPISPGMVSEDAAIAARLYMKDRRELLAGNRQYSVETASDFGSSGKAGDARPQPHDARWQTVLRNARRLEDRFSPGIRAVDVFLNQAAVTCLSNSNALGQLEASPADLHWRRKQIEVRQARSMRRKGLRSGRKPVGKKPAACARPSADQVEEPAGGSMHVLPRRLADTAALNEGATFTASSSIAAGNSLEVHGNPLGEDDPLNSSFAGGSPADEAAAPAPNESGDARVVCSNFEAQLSYFRFPSSVGCGRHTHNLLGSAGCFQASQKTEADQGEKLTQNHMSKPDAGCRCYLSRRHSSSIKEGAGLHDSACDCCCHHHQDYTIVRLGHCEVELSHLDCLLACRCASEQIQQLQTVQKRHQHHRQLAVRLGARLKALQQQLHLALKQKHRLSCADVQKDLESRHSLFSSSMYSSTTSAYALGGQAQLKKLFLSEEPVKLEAAAPEAHVAAATGVQQGIRECPRQSHIFADVPLLRLTLLSDHLDCLQARLLQLLVLQGRVTRAVSILPPRPEEIHAVLNSQQQEATQAAAVTLGQCSLHLWALNPVAVAFEPVLESLPLSIVVREAPYSLMRFAYASSFDDDGLALASTLPPSSTRNQMPDRQASSASSSELHWSGEPVASSDSLATRPDQATREWSSNNSEEKELSSSDPPVLFRFDRDAADLEASSFWLEKHDHRGGVRGQRASGSLSVSGHLGARQVRHQSVNTSSSKSEQAGVQAGPYRGTSDSNGNGAASSKALRKRYLGILISCPKDSTIEANLSPLLLQSIVGSLTKWHCDFAQHVQQPQQGSTSCSSSERLSCAQDSNSTATALLRGEETECDQGSFGAPDAKATCQKVPPLRSLGSSSLPRADTLLTDQGRESRPIQDKAPAAPPNAADSSLSGGEHKQLRDQQAAGPKRGKLFIPYQILNQTGLQLGVMVLSPPGLTSDRDAQEEFLGAATRAALPPGLPSTLRLCSSSTRGAGDEISSNDTEGSSSTSEGGKRPMLSAAPISWDFGPALQKQSVIPLDGSAAVNGKSSNWTASCPPSPSSRELFATNTPGQRTGPRESVKWEWLRPMEEKALSQVSVSIGAASTVHVALQLVCGSRCEDSSNSAAAVAAAVDQPGQEARGTREVEKTFERRWKLVFPVPLDRAGVYIQPLRSASTVQGLWPPASRQQRAEEDPFVVCRVVADSGTKRLLVQSQVVLRSSCSCPLEVMVLPDDASSLIPHEQVQRACSGNGEMLQLHRLVLNPGGTTAVPVDLCFKGRIRVRPVQSECAYTWSRELSLSTVWQFQRGADGQRAQSQTTRRTSMETLRAGLPKLDLLRCCPLKGPSREDDFDCGEEILSKGQDQAAVGPGHQCDYHMVVLYGVERLFHSSFSCIQLRISFEAPLRLASNVPFPIRYKVHSPVALEAGGKPPEDLEGSLRLNDCQQVHSFPLAGIAFLSLSLSEGRWSSRTQIHPKPLRRRRFSTAVPPTAAAKGSAGIVAAAGREPNAGGRVNTDAADRRGKEAAEEALRGDTVVEAECMDSKYRVAKLWVVFCESDGGIPSLLLHAPLWLVSYVNWALQPTPQQRQRDEEEHEKAQKTLPAVEFRTTRRSSPADGGWALEAVTSAVAAVDLNEAAQHRSTQVARFDATADHGCAIDCDGEIQLLDFDVESFRVEADSFGRSEYVDLWGESPKVFQLCAHSSTRRDGDSQSTHRMQKSEHPSASSPYQGAAALAENSPHSGGENEASGLATTSWLPCLDLVAAVREAPMPLLRPVLLLTVAPMYTITSRCPFPLRARQALPGRRCYGCTRGQAEADHLLVELLPEQTRPLVWQSAEGSRALQFQCLLPTLCWLQHGCSRASSKNRMASCSWGAWSGYSPLCPPGEEWCLRLPGAGASELSPARSQARSVRGQTTEHAGGQDSEQSCTGWPDKRDSRRLHQQQPSGVRALQLLGALLRRGVTVGSKGPASGGQSPTLDPFASTVFDAATGCSLRLEAKEGAASSINLVLRKESFERRDAIAISNNTPLPLLVRQCRHRGSPPSPDSAAESRPSAFGGNFPFLDAAALGVDSVTSTVADLWEGAKQRHFEEHQQPKGLEKSSSFTRFGTIYGNQAAGPVAGGRDSATQLIDALLEKQRRTDQQQHLQRRKGTSSFHSSSAVYISPFPHEEAVNRLVDRLAGLAEAVSALGVTENNQSQLSRNTGTPSSCARTDGRCVWCHFESASAHELSKVEDERVGLSQIKEDEEAPVMLCPAPQLVLPGETVLYAWDDYRCLACLELTYHPWFQQQRQREQLAAAGDSKSRDGEVGEEIHPLQGLLSLDRPFVVCIPLHPSVSGLVQLSPLPSSCWLLFRVLRSAGQLLLQIVPVASLCGVPGLSPSAVRGEEKSSVQGSVRHRPEDGVSSLPQLCHGLTAAGVRSPWNPAASEQIVAFPGYTDVSSLLVLPRYFLMPVVSNELDALCSRSEKKPNQDSRVPSWSYASLCRFAETFGSSYASSKEAALAAAAAANSLATGALWELERAHAALPQRPTPEPPSFELRIELPRVQLSVLSKGPVTDPLYRQIDSMHPQAYYPVLLQRAPPMPSQGIPYGDAESPQRIHAMSSRQQPQQPLERGTRQRASELGSHPLPSSEHEPLVEILLLQRQPNCRDDHQKVVLIDKCCVSIRPVSVKTDLNSFYVGTEALGCWRAAWVEAKESAQLQLKGSLRSAAHAEADVAARHRKGHGTEYSVERLAVASLGEQSSHAGDEILDYQYSLPTGLEWACASDSPWRFPYSLFASRLLERAVGTARSPLVLRPIMVQRPDLLIRKQQQEQFQRPQKRYVFKVFSIAPTCVVLSFKADTGDNSSALRRSVITLSSLEEARFQVEGLTVNGFRLTEKLRELQQQQQPELQQGLCLLSQVQRHHRLPALKLRDVARLVGHFYRQQLSGHLSKVIASVDLLGNPALSFAHLQAGVYALARQPLEAAETGGDVFQGMIRGAEDFLKHTGYGFFGGISRMTGVASDSLGALAFDEVYIHARKQHERQKARNVEEGLQQGVEALGRALAGGLTGLVEEPVKGAAEGGLGGLLRGAGRGLAGFIVKPITGVLDLAHKTAEAIKDASQIEAYQRPRRRLPRMLLGASRLLVAYDNEAAEAKAILTEAEGQYWGNLPVLFFALEKRLQRLTVLTEGHILLFRINTKGPAELQFLSPIARILAVGHCSLQSSTSSGSSRKPALARERHLVVLQLRRTGDAGVCYKWLAYSTVQLQCHVLHSLRQLFSTAVTCFAHGGLHMLLWGCAEVKMRGPSAPAEEAKLSEASPQQATAEAQEEAFDEPDDELEEFDEIGGDVPVDAEVKQWSEDWDAAGWDDEDPDDEFLERLQRELEAFKTNYTNKNSQARKAA